MTLQDIENAAAEIYKRGGKPDRIRANTKTLRDVMGLSPQDWFWQNPGGLVFRVLHTSFGCLTVEIADDAPDGKLYIDNKEHTESVREMMG